MSKHDPYAATSAVAPRSSAPAEALSSPAPDATPAGSADTQTRPESTLTVELPQGTTKELVAWVDGDLVRAQAIIDAELATDQPRKGLLSELQELVNDE